MFYLMLFIFLKHFSTLCCWLLHADYPPEPFVVCLPADGHPQTKLDIARGAINVPREAYRQRHLEAERKRQEELAAQEAAQRAELEAKPEKGNKSGKKSAGDKKKKWKMRVSRS